MTSVRSFTQKTYQTNLLQIIIGSFIDLFSQSQLTVLYASQTCTLLKWLTITSMEGGVDISKHTHIKA